MIRFKVGIPTTALEILLLVAIGLGLLALGRRLPVRNPYTWPALVFLIAATLDVFFSPDRRAAAGIWKAYFVEPALAALVIAGLARSRSRVILLLGSLAVAGMVIAVANLAADLREVFAGTYNLVTPPVAIYQSANAIPLYLVPLDAVAFAFLLYSDDARERVAAALFALVTALAVVFSLSRAGLVSLVVVAVFAGLFHRWRWRMLAGIGAGAAIGILAVPALRRRLAVELDPSDPNNTIRLRLSLWRASADMLRHNPVFGGGLSGFSRSLDPYRDPTNAERLIYPHNIVLNFWSETGLLGLAAFFWLCASVVRASVPGIRAGSWVRVVSIGILGVLVAFGVHGLADVPYFKNDQALAFWALLGIQLGAFGSREVSG